MMGGLRGSYGKGIRAGADGQQTRSRVNSHRLTSVPVLEEEALRPPAQFPHFALQHSRESWRKLHRSLHQALPIAGQDQLPASLAGGPGGIGHTPHSAIVEDERLGAKSPTGIWQKSQIIRASGYSV